MSSKRIVEYLKLEIKKVTKEVNDYLNEIKLIEYNIEQNFELYHQLKEKGTIASEISMKSIEKMIKNQQDKVEILKHKLDIAISGLASKKANLHWIEDDYEED